MTFTSKTSEPTLRVPFGWDVIEADDVPESKPSSSLEEENTSSFSAEAQANSHTREAGQK